MKCFHPLQVPFNMDMLNEEFFDETRRQEIAEEKMQKEAEEVHYLTLHYATIVVLSSLSNSSAV